MKTIFRFNITQLSPPPLPLSIPLFTFGKYRNETFDSVLDRDPAYIKWAYETVQAHAGIPHKTYTAACEALDHGDDDPEDMFSEGPGAWGID